MEKIFNSEMQMNHSAINKGPLDGLLRGVYSEYYKVILICFDIVLTSLVFFTAAVITSDQYDWLKDFQHATTVAIFALTSILFFNSFRLYNYHIIYKASTHVKLLLRVWGLNLFILLSTFAILVLLPILSDVYFFLVTAAVAGALLLFKNYYNDLSIHLLMALGISCILSGWLIMMPPEAVAALIEKPTFIFSGFTLAVLIVSLCRYLIVNQLFCNVLKRDFRRQTIIFGSNQQAASISEYIIDNNTPFWIAGVLGADSSLKGKEGKTKENLGKIFDFPKIEREIGVNEVIVTDEAIDKLTLISILDYCTARRINVWFPPNYMPIICVKLYIDSFCGMPMIRLGAQKNHWFFNKVKHTIDALLTLPGFLLISPFFLAILAAVRLTSPGPAFYRANAIGKGGRNFTMYKFRSMFHNNDPTVHKRYVTRLIKGEIKNDEGSSKVLKLTDDKRITPVGKFIRKFSLDELPQLINVLKGDMSLIGPRPCLPYEYEAYRKWHKKRLSIRPGITGLWQVTGRSEVAFEDMILLDLFYIYNRSVSLDLSILFETIFVVIGKKGGV